MEHTSNSPPAGEAAPAIAGTLMPNPDQGHAPGQWSVLMWIHLPDGHSLTGWTTSPINQGQLNALLAAPPTQLPSYVRTWSPGVVPGGTQSHSQYRPGTEGPATFVLYRQGGVNRPTTFLQPSARLAPQASPANAAAHPWNAHIEHYLGERPVNGYPVRVILVGANFTWRPFSLDNVDTNSFARKIREFYRNGSEISAVSFQCNGFPKRMVKLGIIDEFEIMREDMEAMAAHVPYRVDVYVHPWEPVGPFTQN